MVKQGRIFIIFCLLSGAVTASAQDNIPVRTLPSAIFRTINKPSGDTVKWKWKRGGMMNLNMNQGSLRNWAAGGDNFSLSISSYVNTYFFLKSGKHSWDNNIDFNFGYIQTSSLGGQKNDDRFDYLSKYGYQIDSSGRWYLSVLLNPRTQFFDGRTYYSRDSSQLSSTFLSPGYLTTSLGIDFHPNKNFSLFMSPLTSRITFVAKQLLAGRGLYGVDSGKHSISQIGAFASINYSKDIMKNVSYKGRVDLFADYKTKPQNTDVYMTNLFNFKINKFLSATYSLDLIYDDDVKLFGPDKNSPGLQLKSLIGIGFSLPFKVGYKRQGPPPTI